MLSRAARLVLDRIEIEHAHHGGNDNGRLPVTFDHFVEFGVHRHSIGPALRELCALGYIEVTEHGQAGNGEWRRPNRFRLTYRPVGNAKPTDEWRRIKTEQDAELTARNPTPQRTAVTESAPQKNRRPVTVCAKNQGRQTDTENPKHEIRITSNGADSVTTSIFSGKRSAPASKGRACSPQVGHRRVRAKPDRDGMHGESEVRRVFFCFWPLTHWSCC